MQQNMYVQQVQEKISKLTPNDVTYFLKKELDDLVSSNDHYNTKLLLELISLPDYAQFSKGLQMERAFDLLLNNIQIKQVSKISQKFLSNKINPSDRILSKIVDHLCKEAQQNEIEELFKQIQQCNSNVNLVEVFNPLFVLNNIVLIRKILVTMSLENFGINQIWTSIIEAHFQKSYQIDELRAALKEFVSQNLQKFDLMENLYNIVIDRSVFYRMYNHTIQKQKSNPNMLITIMHDMISFQLKFQQQSLTKSFIYLIEQNIPFKETLKLIIRLKYCLTHSTYQQILEKYISNNQKFELFCLIELLLQEQGFNFKFEDLMLSQNDLKYIVIQQSFFNKFLNKVEKSKNSCQQITFENDEQLFQEKQDYLLECISFASEVSDISEI